MLLNTGGNRGLQFAWLCNGHVDAVQQDVEIGRGEECENGRSHGPQK